MAKRKNILPYLTIGTLINEATGKRVSKEARQTGADILEEVAAKIIKKSALLADHARRKTIKGKDVQLAFNQLKEEL